jgi:soluble lytic murein transglycosylase
MFEGTRHPRALSGARAVVVLAVCALVSAAGGAPRAQQSAAGAGAAGSQVPALAPTRHPPVPRDLSSLWLAPSDADHAARPPGNALASFAVGVRLQAEAKYEQALPLLSAAALADTRLADYATYYTASVELRLLRVDEARRHFAVLGARKPSGYLSEAAALGEAEAAEAQNDYAAALRIYDQLWSRKPSAPDELWLRIAKAALAAGDRRRAAEAYLRLYCEYPLSDLAAEAATAIRTIAEVEPIRPSNARYRLELTRAECLFANKRYADARTSFTALRPHASGDDKELIALRLAECDYYTRRYGTARTGVRPYLTSGTHQAEARYFSLMAARRLGDRTGFVRLVHELARDYPASPWAEEALNSLATIYIQQDQDENGDLVLRELYDKFPTGRYAERAAWKIGWRAYRSARFVEAATIFEKTAAAFPRSDYRPPWLYWAGRARDAAGDRAAAGALYTLVTADYLNSYYGRLATRALEARGERPASSGLVLIQPTASAEGTGGQGGADLAAACHTIRLLLALELYDDAMRELGFAQRTWGDSPVIQATIGWVSFQQGEFRRAINTMKRAYPQYLAAGGEQLPVDVQTIIFPIGYWDLIKKSSAEHDLDPYLLAALIAQESTFVPDIRSPARAVGLMQLIPSTARLYARKLKLRYSLAMLRNPELNVRMGTAYLSDLMKEFGEVHLALAGYNAGEGRVRSWRAERPRMDRDEFIDDIPFAETQSYVKRILGTADDYRRLYGDETPAASGAAAASPGASRAVAGTISMEAARARAVAAASKPPAAKKAVGPTATPPARH